MSRNRLEEFIAELCSTAKDLCPEAEISVSTESREGEDATIEIVVPEDKDDEVSEALSWRRYEIFEDEGYDIVLWIREREGVEVSK